MQQTEHNTCYPLVLLDTIGEAVFVIDTQWRYTYVNKKAEELAGRPCAELPGSTIWELFPETVATTFSAEMHRAVQQNTPTCIETYYSPLQKWFESRIYPSAAGLAVLSQDITGRVSRSKAFPGLGMGLYIAHEIVKQHGGEITVESEEGKGSAFVVSLPRKK
jgi:PAS domain S-box-containing protein